MDVGFPAISDTLEEDGNAPVTYAEDGQYMDSPMPISWRAKARTVPTRSAESSSIRAPSFALLEHRPHYLHSVCRSVIMAF
mmetsp:Transcript_18562/g.45691  ORF Transcript_18562/g.45691 Transcript_18562/m.45691 type:complete len:81 (-) Transcript_18562:467-709(-)